MIHLTSIILKTVFLSLMWISLSIADDHGHKDADKKHQGHGHSDNRHEDNDDHEENDHDDHKGHSDHDEHGGEESFGKGKAITEVQNEGERFKLAKEAQDLMGLKYGSVDLSSGANMFKVPTQALVFFNDEKGVFIRDGDWFRFVEVKVIKMEKAHSQIMSRILSSGQRVVIAGTGLLRVAHLQASGQGGKGHAH